MHPHTNPEPGPELAAFAETMRSVLRTRHDSPGDGPDALESWRAGDGYAWQWSTTSGLWRATAGGAADPRPLLHGPGGIWRVDAPADPAGAEVVLVMLRAAGALPPPAAARRLAARHMYAVVRGQRFPLDSAAAEPARAVLLRASDPEPDELPAGYVAVRATSDEPDGDGRWEVVMPDGFHRHRYDPARRCLLPYPDGTGTALLLFEPDQIPGHAHPAERHAAAA